MSYYPQPDDGISGTAPQSTSKSEDTTPGKPATAEELEAAETKIEGRMSTFERSTLRWTKAMFGVTAATALFIGFQWHEMHTGAIDTHTLAESAKKQAENTAQQLGIAQAQVKAALDQVDAIKRQMRQDQRPWVTMAPAWPEQSLNGIPGQIVILNAGQRLQVPIKVNNTGKTPALSVSYTIHIEVVDRDKAPLLSHPINPSWHVTGSTMFPNSPETAFAYRLKQPQPREQIAFNDLTSTELQSLNEGKSYLAVYGEISYSDGFGIHHWTHFCAPVTFTQKFGFYSWRPCTKYNTTDTNQ